MLDRPWRMSRMALTHLSPLPLLASRPRLVFYGVEIPRYVNLPFKPVTLEELLQRRSQEVQEAMDVVDVVDPHDNPPTDTSTAPKPPLFTPANSAPGSPLLPPVSDLPPPSTSPSTPSSPLTPLPSPFQSPPDSPITSAPSASGPRTDNFSKRACRRLTDDELEALGKGRRVVKAVGLDRMRDAQPIPTAYRPQRREYTGPPSSMDKSAYTKEELLEAGFTYIEWEGM